MGRFDRAGFSGETADSDTVAAAAWDAAIDQADISADYADDCEDPELREVEDDLLSLIAHRPSRRARLPRPD